jgi:hypothetical protein
MKPAFAVLIGVIVSVVLIIVGTLIAAAELLPPRVDWVAHMPGPAYLAATLGLSFGAAVLGGFVAAQLSQAHRFRVAAAVAGVLAVLELASFILPFTGTPPFFLWLVPLLVAVGALAGGGVRALDRAS